VSTAAQSTPPADATALEIFQNQWDVYRKFLQYDYLSNAAVCQVLRRFLDTEIARPFRFLDLACGDASAIAPTLQPMPVEAYRGVDLSAPALALAARNLAVLPCEAQLDEADFTTALQGTPNEADIVWISLSLHHLATDAKRTFMRHVRAGIASGGAFLIYEPTRQDGEDRVQYLDRFEVIGRRDWTALTPAEFAEAMKHVRGCDLPETMDVWSALGRDAGFSGMTELFRDPSDLLRLIAYRP